MWELRSRGARDLNAEGLGARCSDIKMDVLGEEKGDFARQRRVLGLKMPENPLILDKNGRFLPRKCPVLD